MKLPKTRADSALVVPRLGVGVVARIGPGIPSLLLDAASGGELVDLVGLRLPNTPIASGLTVELIVVEGDTVSDGWSIVDDSPPFALIVML